MLYHVISQRLMLELIFLLAFSLNVNNKARAILKAKQVTLGKEQPSLTKQLSKFFPCTSANAVSSFLAIGNKLFYQKGPAFSVFQR